MSFHNPGTLPDKPHCYGLSFNTLAAEGSLRYKRRLHLQQLLPITATVVEDQSRENCQWILGRLARALRRERNRGRKAHWAYSLNRHLALLQAYRGEQKVLENLNNSGSGQKALLNLASARSEDENPTSK